MTEDGRDRVRVRAIDGVDEITVERAPKVGLWLSGPWRWWSTITRDSSWWLTVGSSAVGWPVLREKYRTAEAAERRSSLLAQGIRRGDWAPPKAPPLRRRWG